MLCWLSGGGAGNTKYLVDASAANERASASLEVMQVVLGGTLGFSIIDRLAGGTMNMDQPDWVNKTVVRARFHSDSPSQPLSQWKSLPHGD